jgi:AcrR family transcriptional regulator
LAVMVETVRKVGRPARISRRQIAEAANELGLTDLTLKAVADRLGVSIASLYHHVEGKDDLLRLAAEHSAASSPVPQDRGQHWAVWLLEWAFHNRDAFVAEPGLLGQYVDGAISADVIAENTDAILGVLMRQGFTAREAQNAYHLVSATAIGSAVVAVREQREAAAGRPAGEAFRRAVAQHADGGLPHLEQLLDEVAVHPMASFEETVLTALRGVAAERGDDWSAIEAELSQV